MRLPPPETGRLRQPLRRLGIATAACAALVGLSVEFVDRPVASWVHDHLGDARFEWFASHYDGQLLPVGPFSVMAGPAQAMGPIAVIALAILSIAAATGRRAGMRGRVILALAVSVFAAKEATAFAKWVFGRTWPESWLGTNPSWIRDGAYGFFPFHGGSGWGSFPSGHTAVIMTPMTILWLAWPERRAIWATLVCLVIAGLIGGNYHFVSDIFGGLWLGAFVGIAITKLMLSPRDRLDWSILLRSAPLDAPRR